VFWAYSPLSEGFGSRRGLLFFHFLSFDADIFYLLRGVENRRPSSPPPPPPPWLVFPSLPPENGTKKRTPSLSLLGHFRRPSLPLQATSCRSHLFFVVSSLPPFLPFLNCVPFEPPVFPPFFFSASSRDGLLHFFLLSGRRDAATDEPPPFPSIARPNRPSTAPSFFLLSPPLLPR